MRFSTPLPKLKMDDTAFFLSHRWKREGKSVNTIAGLLGVDWKTVATHLRRRLPPSRRPPRKTNTVIASKMKQRRSLIRQYHAQKVQRNGQKIRRRYPSCAALRGKIGQDGLRVSSMTVRRDLWVLKRRARRRPKGVKPKMGDKELRLEFCQEIARDKKYPFGRLIFSDEKIFDTNDHGCQWEWVKENEQPKPLHRERWAPRAHVWGCIGVGIKHLIVLPKQTINGEGYCEVLKQAMPLFKNRVLMQDGAKAHTCAITKAFLAKHGVETMDSWPARSPDLNPIETLWAIMNRKVSDCGPMDEASLARFVRKTFDEYPQAGIDKLVRSFEKRVKNCINRKGGSVQ